jgi:hypothetical protein
VGELLGSYCLIRTVSIGVMKNVWKWMVVMVAHIRIQLMILNNILKMVKMANFMLPIISQLKKFKR